MLVNLPLPVSVSPGDLFKEGTLRFFFLLFSFIPPVFYIVEQTLGPELINATSTIGMRVRYDNVSAKRTPANAVSRDVFLDIF